MGNIIKHAIAYICSVCTLLGALVFGFGCSPSKPASDPLTGFHWSSLNNLDSNKAIDDDCKDYIHKLSPEESVGAGREYFEDGTGRHAIKITIGVNGKNWEHVLIYDKDNHRIYTIKYVSGHSES